MTNQERYTYFESGVLQRTTQMELLDWAGYWATEGLDEITDRLQKEQTRVAINMILTDTGNMTKKVARLAISYDVFKTKSAAELTDEDIHLTIVNIMANKLMWLTGISSVAAEEPEVVSEN